MEKGRLVYIEPNDIVKDHVKLYNSSHKNFTWNPEDLNLYVDLQVVCPSRNDCGTEPEVKNGRYSNTYISLMEGEKIGKRNSLTTDYTNISYSEIKNNNVSSKEALGITSIDITFDAHFYPKVTINFTDVHAYSLFMPAEEEYKEGLKSKAFEAGKYHEAGRAYTNFFNAVFHFPYPRFLLTVKGFYGTKVTFILAVETFKSALNSNTGNFDVTINFIGYMYGIYTDIPMNFLMCAPYISKSDYSESDVLIKGEYWNRRVNEGVFVTKDGEQLPTFLEFAKRYAIALNNINGNVGTIGEHIVEINDTKYLLAKIDEISKKIENLVLNNFALDPNDVNKHVYSKSIGSNNKKYHFFIFEKNSSNSDIEVKWDKTLSKEINELIDDTNTKFADLLRKHNGTITYPMLCSNPEVFKGTVVGKVSDFVISRGENNGKKIVEKIQQNAPTIRIDKIDYTYNTDNDDTNALVKFVKDRVSQGGGTKIENLYFCAINLYETLHKLNELKNKLEKEKNDKEGAASIEAENYISQQLGFKPSIENIFRMVFAHLDCFFHEYLEECVYKIKDSERKINDDIFIPKLNGENTDVKYKDKDGNVFLPPFFAYYILNGQGQKELAYPGMYDIEEVSFVNRLLNSAKQYHKEYNDIVKEVDELSTASSNYNNEEYDIGNFGLPISFNDGFSPSSYYDIFYGDKNPYSYLNSDSALLIKDIFYTFALRYYSLMMLGVSNSSSTVVENEVNNVIACFPNINKEKFEEIFDQGNDGNTLYRYVNEYSQKRIVQIDKLNIPKTEKLKKLLLLTRIDTSTTYDDEGREVALNNIYENTFEYLRGIKILDTHIYDEFGKLKSKLSEQYLDNNRTLFDNTQYIINNEKASKRPVHKLYTTKAVAASVIDTTFTDKDVEQLPTEGNYSECKLPFILWAELYGFPTKRRVRNLLYDLSQSQFDQFRFSNGAVLNVQELSIEAKAFFILSSLIVSIEDIRDSFNSVITGRPANDLFGRKITKTRKIIPLFYGCILYIFRKRFKEGIDLVPNLITIDSDNKTFNVNLCITEDSEGNNNHGLFRYDYQVVDVKNNINSKVIVNLIKQLLCVHSEEIKNKYITSENIDLTNDEINDIFNNLNGLTDIEKYFLNETREGGILQEIINAAKEEVNSCFSNSIHLEHSSGGDFKSYDKVQIYPLSGKTNNAIVRLMSETVCMVSTTYVYSKPNVAIGIINNGANGETANTYAEKSFEDLLKSRLQEFYNKLSASYQDSENKTEEYVLLEDQTNIDIKRSLYYTLKSLYDKWICSYGNMERFRLNKVEDDVSSKNDRFKNGIYVSNKTEINNFLFVDSLYRDIGQDFICDPSSVIRLSQTTFDGKNNFSVYQFLHALCQENKLLMRAIPVYNNFYTERGLKEIFTPKDVFNANQAQENGFSSTYLIMYTHQPSTHLNKESSEYQDDGMYICNDISRTITTTDFEKIFLDKANGYIVPTFGVTYGMQNQSYFKGININMDNPITTDYSIANQLMISQTAASGGDLNLPLGIGQNIYSIYSNRSYNCTVEMMGCANIMPMMYFQLNNIPMFKGVYMITSVKHSIRSGNMTTIFTGVRQTSIIYPFVNSNLILTTILDRSNGPLLYKVIKTEVETIENNDGSIRINNNSNSVTKIMEPQYYTDITITNGSLLDETWMKARRDEWREEKTGKYRHLTNSYWGQPYKGKNYPLSKRKTSDIKFIILHFANTPDSNYDRGKNDFRALNMRNGWFSSWLKSSVTSKPSADFGIDDTHIVQFTPDYNTYAGLSVNGNISGISIEMCNTFSGTYAEYATDIANRPQYGFSEQVLENTRKLIIEIFLQIGPKDITTHYRRRVAINAPDPKKCPGIWGWNMSVKRNENGVDMRDNKGLLVFNNEDKLDAFIESVWEEWVKVAEAKGREVGTKIKKVY
jgi:hypothetical protein